LDDPHNSIPPEAATDIKVRFYPQLTDPADVKLRSATETIRLLRQRVRGAIWELRTDGALARRTGAGVAQLYLGPDEPQPRWTEKTPAGNCTDPYATKSLAVKVSLAKITNMRRPGPNKTALIVYTDSQKLITALQKGPVRQRVAQLASIWKSIYTLHQQGIKKVTFQWIPAHFGVPRNKCVVGGYSTHSAPSRSAESRFDIRTSSRTIKRRIGLSALKKMVKK